MKVFSPESLAQKRECALYTAKYGVFLNHVTQSPLPFPQSMATSSPMFSAPRPPSALSQQIHPRKHRLSCVSASGHRKV